MLSEMDGLYPFLCIAHQICYQVCFPPQKHIQAPAVTFLNGCWNAHAWFHFLRPGLLQLSPVCAPIKVLYKLQWTENSVARVHTQSRRWQHITAIVKQWCGSLTIATFCSTYKPLLLSYKASHNLAPLYQPDLLKDYSPYRKLWLLIQACSTTHPAASLLVAYRAFSVADSVLWNTLFPLLTSYSLALSVRLTHLSDFARCHATLLKTEKYFLANKWSILRWRTTSLHSTHGIIRNISEIIRHPAQKHTSLSLLCHFAKQLP